MRFGATRVCLAFDASAVCGARVSAGLRGLELRAWARAPLPPGALRPAPADANLTDAGAVQQALRQVAATLEAPPQAKLRVVLPDGLARLVLLDQPPGVAPADFARFRLAPGLPYAPDEAVVGVLPAGGRQVLAAALRRATAAEYEAAVRAAGFVPDGVFLAPLATLSGLVRRPPADDAVAVVLGDQALVLAAFGSGRLRLVRSRRRAAGGDEPARIGGEAQRTAAAAELREPLRLVLLGSGARALGYALGLTGQLVEVGRAGDGELPDEAAEWAWLGAAAA